MTTAPRTPPTTALTVRCPEDLLAVVPVVLGFVPTDSVVMLTFGAGRSFHARVDLPRRRDDVAEVVDALRAPALEHGVRGVVFVLYAARPPDATRVADALVDGFRAASIEVLDVLRADGGRWWPMLRARSGAGRAGVPYDVSAHPFAAQAVLDGRVTHASRAELVASIERQPERVAALERALASLPRWGRGAAGDEAWVRDLVRRHVDSGEVPADAEVARLLLALGDRVAHDAAWCLMTRAGALGQVAFWTDVVRRAPDALLAAPAALLAFAAWLAGNGALAWCALDRCRAVAPDHALAGHVAEALVRAVPPQLWEEGGRAAG